MQGRLVPGIQIHGIPLGDPEYITAFLAQKAVTISTEQARVIQMLHPEKFDNASPTLQCLWVQLYRCLIHKSRHYLRHIDPTHTETFATLIEAQHNSLLSYLFGKDITNESDFTQQRLHLPIRLGGLGIPCLKTIRFIDFIGGFWQGYQNLLDRQELVEADDGTSSYITRKGCMQNISTIVTFVGQGSFDDSNLTPLATILSQKHSSSIAASLDSCWNALTNHTQQLNVNGDPTLFNRNAANAGTCDKGFMLQPSVTRQLTHEFHRLQLQHVSALSKTNQEALSYTQHNHFSWQFLLARPNKLGCIPNRLLPEILNNFLGLSSPNFECGGYIGRLNPIPVDRYGNNVATCGDIPGPGFTYVHNKVRDCIIDLLRTANLDTKQEVVDPYREYIPPAVQILYESLPPTQRKCIRADIRVSNYPNNISAISNWTTASNQTTPAMFEVKSIWPGARYPPQTQLAGPMERATDKRGKEVERQYRKNAYDIDSSLNLARADFDTPGEKGPFEQGLGKHHSGNVIPLVVGFLGETNKALDKLISNAACLAAKTSYGKRLSAHPFGKGSSPEAILKEQFRRRLGIEIACAYAHVKLERLQLIGSTPQEAKDLAEGHRRPRWWHRDSMFPSLFRASYVENAFYRWRDLCQFPT